MGAEGDSAGLESELEDTRRANRVIRALAQCQASLAEVEDPEAIFDVLGPALRPLGLTLVVFVLADPNTLVLRHHSHDPRGVAAVADEFDLRLEGLSIHVDDDEFVRGVIRDGQSRFLHDATPTAHAVLGGRPSTNAATVARLRGLHRTVGTPLVVGNELEGMIVLHSRWLRESDLDVVRLFAGQISATISRIRQSQRLAAKLEALHDAERRLGASTRKEAVGVLAGGLAHDFNNALMRVLAASTELQMLELGAEVDELVATIESAATQASRAVRRMLAHGRDEEFSPAHVDTARLLQHLARILRRTLPESVALELDLAPGLSGVFADRDQLEQTITNLVANSRDALERGGTIVIRARDDEGAGAVVISVQDDGAGMSPEVLERAFEVFFSTKDPERGSGMGLPLVKAVVEQHGGEVRVHSEVGGGTRVELVLPRGHADCRKTDRWSSTGQLLV